MYQRFLQRAVQTALLDTPVVFLAGARQVGKSTFTKILLAARDISSYVSLDVPANLASASLDPDGFLQQLSPTPAAIDEAQRVPDLFLPIKRLVDEDRQPGRFLLTGSANILLLPNVANYLAGRMEIKTLWPLSQGELEGHQEAFIDNALFGTTPPRVEPRPQRDKLMSHRDDIIARIVGGGFPEAIERSTKTARREAWFDSYVASVIERDVRDFANIERLAQLPQLLRLLAARTAQMQNQAEVSRSFGVPLATLRRYLAYLHASYMIYSLPPWAPDRSRRITRSPKLHMVDSGLAAHLLRVDSRGIAAQPELLGQLLESFVVMELVKQQGWATQNTYAYHYRQASGAEVDLVLETSSGEIAGIEVKSSQTVGSHDFRGLRALAEHAGKKFHRGIVLYMGEETLPFGENFWAMPLSALWRVALPGTNQTR